LPLVIIAVSQSVHGANATSVTLTSSVNPTSYGQSTTFTAAVAGTTSSGTVTFKENGNAISSAVSVNRAGINQPTIAAGAYHTCAVTNAGAVKCWGQNHYGQLGVTTNTGTDTPNATPVAVTGLSSGVVAITAGLYHTCALTSVGAVKCWGLNSDGELGVATNNNTSNPNATPVAVTGLSAGVVAISAGSFHTCALTNLGAVQCWGSNYYGALGVTANVLTGTANPTPVAVTGLSSGVSTIAAGSFHTCAILGGAVKCWGLNVFGQIGVATNTGTYNANPTPVTVSNLTNIVGLTAGGFDDRGHTCAVTNGGAVKCWGDNQVGALGINSGSPASSSVPLDVSGLSNGVVSIAAGSPLLHTCAVTSAGGVKCWGNNGNGQLGNNSTTSSPVPVDVSGLNDVSALATGGFHTCAMTGSGAIHCWGNNGAGQVGDGGTTQRLTPISGSNLGSGTGLLYGQADYTTVSLSAGSHAITAVHSDGGNPSVITISEALTQTVNKASTTISLTSNVNPAVNGHGNFHRHRERSGGNGKRHSMAQFESVRNGLPLERQGDIWHQCGRRFLYGASRISG
jgi:alpha-tubulin suppressor-like RCC1 family protein